jgi:nucleoid DNA-binding protein
MDNKIMYLKEFSGKVEKALQKTDNNNLKNLTEDDIREFIPIFWEMLAYVLSQGYKVTLYGIGSFFRKAVKRVGFSTPSKTNEKRKSEKTMFHQRIRVEFSPALREKAEVEISETEYLYLKAKDDEKKKKK